MGALRLLLAISVVLAHTLPDSLPLVGGKLAVEIFYILSGYLISYILVEKKFYTSRYKFYISRALRLYPIYLVMMLATFCVYCLGSGKFFDLYRALPGFLDLWLVFSNIFILGQDLVMFVIYKDGILLFPQSFLLSDIPIWRGLLVPQAWTLSLELTFYLLSPFILHRFKLVLVIFTLSFALKVALFFVGIGDTDPWSYRFFPAELFLFLGGVISQQVLSKKFLTAMNCRSLCALFTLVVLALVVFFPLINVENIYKEFLVIICVFALLPFLFAFENYFSIDKWLAELSYPIYINHMFFIIILTPILGVTLYTPYFVLGFSVAGAIFLNKYIAAPVDLLRHRFRHPAAHVIAAK